MREKRVFTGTIGRCVAETKVSFDVYDSPSKGKPNVIYLVLDDVGFAQLGCYGSSIDTPNIDRLASKGLRYNNFHTTAICAATRASLLTGANHHSVGINTLPENYTALPNSQGCIRPEYATLAEILKTYDYRTMAVGKWHLNSIDERTASGPFDNWPLGKGFETYYGFLSADMDQWNPVLTRDNSMVFQPKTAKDGYHFSEDITDEAIKNIYNHEFSYPEQPFFLYLAYGAMHSPHHAPKKYIDAYKGRFDNGWDALREESFERQKKMGIIPEKAVLTERNEYVSAWDELSDNQKKAYAKSMEVFAGFLTHTDEQIGRLIDYLEDAGIFDNTIFVLLSDNGASAEGGRDGHFNLNTSMDITEDYPRDVELILDHIDSIGDEYSNPHYATGWANAGNTPFKWYKQWNYEGGVKDPLIISYPNYIKDAGGIRTQFNHVIDITPTVLDLLEFEKPKTIKGVPQKDIQGISFKNTLNDPYAISKKTVQYFEMYGNRAIYKDGWKAVVNHYFNASKGNSYDDDVWELYHVDEDYSESRNVAELYPDKLRELKDEWLIEAAKYDVFPMVQNGFVQSKDAYKKVSSRFKSMPPYSKKYHHVDYPYDMPHDPGLGVKTSSITAIINRTDTKTEGVILSRGDRFGGLSFYIKDNLLKYAYNTDGDQYYVAVSDRELPLGKVTVRADFELLPNDRASIRLYINEEITAETLIEHLFYSTGNGVPTSLKINKFSSVYDKDYASPFEYNGRIEDVIIDVAGGSIDMVKELEKNLKHD